MNKQPPPGFRRWLSFNLAAALILGANLILATAPAAADSASARRVLKAMSDYMGSQQHLAARFDVSMDIITPQIEKIQFVASGDLLLSRPNNIRLHRVGGYSDVRLFFDGQTATIVEVDDNIYAQLASPGSVDQLFDRLHREFSLQLPGADLLLTNSYDELMRDVLVANHIGTGVVNGVECEHLAFRNAEVDWQIWVRTGDRPLPCRYVITSKTVTGGPEYVVQFHDWRTDPPTERAAFTYTPPRGSTSVGFQALAVMGELPAPAPFSQGN